MSRHVVLDVSSNNGHVDVGGIKRIHPEVDGGFVKATEGSAYVNPLFGAQYDAFRAARLVTGAYGFAHPSVAGVGDVDLFLNTVGARVCELGTAWDCEVADGLDGATILARFLEDLGDRGLARDPRKDLLYTGRWFWDPNTVGSIAAHVERIPLWLSWYKAQLTPDAFPVPWVRTTFWQFTDNYFGTGIDASYFTGTDDEWMAWVGGGPAPTPTPDPGGFGRYTGFPMLRQGARDRGPGSSLADLTHPVTSLQNALNIATKHESAADPYHLGPDGDFGPATDRAVRKLQASFHRTVDGIVGVDTWTLLAFLLTNLHR